MQTTNLACSKKDDIVSEFYHEWGTEIETLLGEWINVNPKTGQIVRLKVLPKEEGIELHCYGKLEQGENDWGIAPCELFSDNVGSPVLEGFICNYDLGFIKINIVGNIKYGVIVIQSYNTFKDGSNRNNYMSREFFRKK